MTQTWTVRVQVDACSVLSAYLFEQRNRSLKLLLSLPRKANNQVGCDRSIHAEHVANALHDPEVGLTRMPPPHPLEDLVVAGLEGNVEHFAGSF